MTGWLVAPGDTVREVPDRTAPCTVDPDCRFTDRRACPRCTRRETGEPDGTEQGT